MRFKKDVSIFAPVAIALRRWYDAVRPSTPLKFAASNGVNTIAALDRHELRALMQLTHLAGLDLLRNIRRQCDVHGAQTAAPTQSCAAELVCTAHHITLRLS